MQRSEVTRMIFVVLTLIGLTIMGVTTCDAQTVAEPMPDVQGPQRLADNPDSWGRLIVDVYALFPNGGDEDLSAFHTEVLFPASSRLTIGIGYGFRQHKRSWFDQQDMKRSYVTSVRFRLFLGD